MSSSHDTTVRQVAAAVREFHCRGEPFRVFHGSTNNTRPAHGSRVVDISALNNVLEVDNVLQRVVTEPNVPMDKLLQATLAHGLMPPVVMEFPGITVGGGFAGSAGESSSFRQGYFGQTVESIEMVLATGDVVQASPSEKLDLFRGADGTAGTLGIVTKLQLRLVPARRFVKLTYRRYTSVGETLEAVRRATGDSRNDYVDGIIFSKTLAVVMTGELTDDIPSGTHPRTFSARRDPWFYLHAREKVELQPSQVDVTPSTDYIPIAEYLFRFDRGGFWVCAHAFAYARFVPFNRVFRWLLDDLLHTRMLYRAQQGSNMYFGWMVQDLSLPYDTAETFIDYTADKLDIWPLWLCPLKEVERPTFHPSCCDPSGAPQPMINVGVWGFVSHDVHVFVQKNKDLERKLAQPGGRKVLYAHTYYTEEEFWSLYGKEWYDSLRAKYGAATLPSVYDKVQVDASQAKVRGKGKGGLLKRMAGTWPFPAFIGVIRALRSKDYLIHRQRHWMSWSGIGTSEQLDGKAY